MPHIAISMYAGRTQEQKQKLANRIQELVQEELGVDKKVISVSVEDIPKENRADNMKQFPDDIMYVKPGI